MDPARRLDLDPSPRPPAGAIAAVEPLGHDSFQAQGADLAEELPAGADNPLGQDHLRMAQGFQQLAELRAPLVQRLVQERPVAVVEEIEDEISGPPEGLPLVAGASATVGRSRATLCWSASIRLML